MEMAAELDGESLNYLTGGECDEEISNGDKRRNHTCTECVSAFPNRMELEEHINSHTGHKPFVCDVCDASFNRRSTLWNHKRIHSDHKPFKCPVCNIEFKWKNSLKCHREMHLRKNDAGSDRFDAQVLRNMSFTRKRNSRRQKTEIFPKDESEATDPLFALSDSVLLTQPSKNQSLTTDADCCISLPKVHPVTVTDPALNLRGYFADGDTIEWKTETAFDYRISSEYNNLTQCQTANEPIQYLPSPIVDGLSVKVLPVEQW